MPATDGRTSREERRTGRKLARNEALERLRNKDVKSPYRHPRGNQEVDPVAWDQSVARFEQVLGG